MKKRTNKKGFTLVELIVVLVILAILAAILVPALLGYIDRAKKQQIVLNAKSALTAAQAEMSSMYGTDTSLSGLNASSNEAKRILTTADIPNCSALIIGTTYSGSDAVSQKHSSYIVTYVKYQEGTDTIYFDGKSWVDDAPATSPTNSYTIK